MRYATRQRLRAAATLAWQRSRHQLARDEWREPRWLAAAIDWQTIGVSSGDREGLAAFCLGGKLDSVRFLASVSDVDWYRRTDPFASHGETLRRAVAVGAHRIEITNLGEIALGDPLEWQRDPVTGTRFPRNRFSVRPASGVDERFRAELNCHRHFPALAAGWVISGRHEYARELLAQLRRWLNAYPPVDDTFLNDGLESTVRILAWTHCLLRLGREAVDIDTCLAVLARIDALGHLIEKQLRHGAAGNNHQVAEAFGLLLIGLVYPELRRAAHWLETGRRLFREQLEAQLLPGGVHAEQSAAYHLFVLECLQLAVWLCRQNGVPADPALLGCGNDATEYLLHLLAPDGTLSRVGDDCGLRIFSPSGATGLRPSVTLAISAFLFDRPDLATIAGPPNEDVFWILGRQGIDWLRQASAAPNPTQRGCILPEAGQAIVRSGWDATSQYLHLDFGRQGLGERPGHGHDDVLSFQYHARGQALVVDSGTYTYLRTHPLRAYFTGPRGHNTILIDADATVGPGRGPVEWQARAGLLLEAGQCDGLAWMRVRHDGYATAAHAIFVERSLLLVTGAYVLVIDRVIGTGMRTIESLLHLAPGLDAGLDGDSAWGRSRDIDLRIAHAASASTQWSLHRGDDPVQPGWYSERYGAVVEAPVLRACSRAALPYWRVSGLFPERPGIAPGVRLTARAELPADDGIEVVIDGVPSDGPAQLRIRWDGDVTQPRMIFTRRGRAGTEEYAYRSTTGACGRIERVSVGGA